MAACCMSSADEALDCDGACDGPGVAEARPEAKLPIEDDLLTP